MASISAFQAEGASSILATRTILRLRPSGRERKIVVGRIELVRVSDEFEDEAYAQKLPLSFEHGSQGVAKRSSLPAHPTNCYSNYHAQLCKKQSRNTNETLRLG